MRDVGDVNVRNAGDASGVTGVRGTGTGTTGQGGSDRSRRAGDEYRRVGDNGFERREERSWSEWLRSPQALHRRHSGTVAAVVQRRLGEGCAVGGCAVSSVFV